MATNLLILSWERLSEDLGGFAVVFYDRLFALDPALRELFHHVNMPNQDKKITAMLGALVQGRVTTDELVALGRRHAGYGVRPQHYRVVVDALLWALEHQLGSSWTPAVRTAWYDALTRAAAVMRAGDRRLWPLLGGVYQ